MHKNKHCNNEDITILKTFTRSDFKYMPVQLNKHLKINSLHPSTQRILLGQ